MKVFLKAVVDYASWFYIIGIIGIIFCLRSAFLARQERLRSIYTLEKEAATSNEFRVLTIGLAVAASLGVVLFLTTVVASRVTFDEVRKTEDMPVAALGIPTVTPTRARPTPTPTATVTRVRPTPMPIVMTTTVASFVPTPTPIPPLPACPNALARLTAPGQNAALSGAVQVLGTANTPNFDYYKLEFAPGELSEKWALITSLRRSPVAGGLLDVWDTTAFPDGLYRLRLVVVDLTGNYPPPCEVRIIISNPPL